MTENEMNKVVDRLYTRLRGVPGMDKDFLKKCVTALASVKDEEFQKKLGTFMRYL